MSPADVYVLAKQAGGDDWGIFRDFMPEIEQLAKLVSEQERERAAMICHACRDLPPEVIAERILDRK